MAPFGLIAAALLACSGDKNGDSGDINAGLCDIIIDSTYPASGAGDFYIRDVIEFELSDDDATATAVLKDASGADVAGTSAVDGDTVTFTPSAALTPSSSYTAELTYCGSADPVSVAFSTSGLGEALADDITGNTYAVDLSSGNFVQPAGVGELIGGLLENDILIGIKSVDGDSMGIRGALSVEGSSAQDYCTETLEEFPDADFSAAPYFEIPQGDVTISVAGITATIQGLSVSGTFGVDADGNEYFGGGELMGQLDARELVDVVAEAGLDAESADDICNLLLGFGVQCVACSDGEPYCATLEVNRLAAYDTGETLGLVCEGDCHESCSSNSDECTQPQAADLAECPQE